MKYKIGVFGSSAGAIDLIMPLATELGTAFGRYADEIIVITGGASGIPYTVASQAASLGVEVWGYSAYMDRASHIAALPNDDIAIYSKLIYAPRDLAYGDNVRVRMKYRNVTSTANCDAGIIISGRWGSLNEFTDLVDMQKSVGVLVGTGGIADQLPHLTKVISKEGQGTILFSDKPSEIIELLLKNI